MVSTEQKKLIQTLVSSLIQTVFTDKIKKLANSARETIGKMRISQTTLNAQISELNSKITDLDLNINRLKAENTNLIETKNLLEEQNSNSQSQLDAHTQAVNSKLETNCGEIAKKNILLKTKQTLYSRQVSTLKRAKITIDGKLRTLNVELEKTNEAKNKLANTIKQIQTEQKNQQQTNTVLTDDLNAKKTMIDSLNSNINKLEINNTTLESKKKELETKNTQLNNQLTQLKVDLTQKTETIKQMKSSTSTDKSEINKLIAKNVDLEYLIKTNETLINSIKTMQQSFVEQKNTNEVQSSKYVSNINNLNDIIKKYKEKNQYLKDKYETHLKALGSKYEESIKDNTKTVEEIQDLTNSFSEKQLAISTKYKKTLITINKNLENMKRTYTKLKNDKANCDEDVDFYKSLIAKMTGQTAELEEKAAKEKEEAEKKLAEQQAAAAAATAASSAELAEQQAAAAKAAAAEAKRRKEERERMKQQLLDAQKQVKLLNLMLKYSLANKK